MDLEEEHRKHREEMAKLWEMKVLNSTTNWRSWGSWFSWGSPVGLGLILVEFGVFLWLLHMAGLIR